MPKRQENRPLGKGPIDSKKRFVYNPIINKRRAHRLFEKKSTIYVILEEEQTMQKKKMSNRRFLKIWIPLVAILEVLILVVTSLMNTFSQTMDTYLGRGERTVTEVTGSETWDTSYYDRLYTTAGGEDGSQLGTASVVEQITDEGIVLMKNSNDTLPISKDSKVTPFGYRYISPIYGGTGSGNVNVDADYVTTVEKAMESTFDVNATVVDAMNKATVYGLSAEGYTAYDDVQGYSGASTDIAEFNPSIYDTDAIKASCQGTVGVVFIARVGGEGGDLLRTEYADGTSHELALTEYEKQTIRFAKENCEKVVVIMNSSNAIEMGPLMSGEYEADAILWIGGPGATGFASMVKVMTGEVNPSGKTVDIFAQDFLSDPALQNFGDYKYDFSYTSLDRKDGSEFERTNAFVEYEEGVYVGYRYYETASDLGYLNYGTLNEDGSIAEAGAVCYPFGYGLSYTTFTQKIVGFEADGDQVNVTVRVTNTGDVAGKDVVQIYYNAPYTDLDVQYGIEKPTANLIAFEKTKLLGQGESEDVVVSFAKEDMASYCYTRENPDGTTGCYMLEGGEYTISVRADSHNILDQETATVAETIWYDGSDTDHIRQSERDAQSLWAEDGTPSDIPEKTLEDADATFVAATNEFQSSNDYMLAGKVTNLSRSDWENTQPTSPTDQDYIPSDAVKEELLSYGDTYGFDYENDSDLGNVEGSKVYDDTTPVENADNGLSLSDMRGLNYYDPLWDDLLDQLDLTRDPSGQLYNMLFGSAYMTLALDDVGKPQTMDLDGPQGITKAATTGAFVTDWCALCAEPVVASTFNKELAYQLGLAVGQEALTTGVNGWYAPGVDLHRTPFSGRNFEYYSEDGVLTGWICANVVAGASQNGLYTFIKHCILNDQETNRQTLCVWATEQTMREIYLKPLEIVAKNATCTLKYISDDEGTVSEKTIKASTAMMVAHNLIGATHAGTHWGFLTGVLRNEWGWHGMVETDMWDPINGDAMLRAGCDIRMNCLDDIYGVTLTESLMAQDGTSNTSKNVLRKTVHDICYAVANSNMMDGAAPGATVTYTMSPWMKWLIAANVVIHGFVIAMVVVMILRTKKAKNHPELFESDRNKKQ
jgi:beta-glucosidase